jgi:hypothetical protein
MGVNLKGDVAEANAVARLIELGHIVSKPANDHAPYDIVVDNGDGFKAVQVKHAKLKNGSITANLRRQSMSANGLKSSTYGGDEIDAYIIYCPTTNGVYWVDYDDAPDKSVTLRVESENDDSRIRWAEEYEV